MGFETDGCGARIDIFLSDELLLQISVPLYVPQSNVTVCSVPHSVQLQSLGLDNRLPPRKEEWAGLGIEMRTS